MTEVWTLLEKYFRGDGDGITRHRVVGVFTDYDVALGMANRYGYEIQGPVELTGRIPEPNPIAGRGVRLDPEKVVVGVLDAKINLAHQSKKWLD